MQFLKSEVQMESPQHTLTVTPVGKADADRQFQCSSSKH